MNLSLHPRSRAAVRPGSRFMTIVWPLVFAKCAAVWWVIDHWSVPVAPAWIIAPTIVFAALATALWFAHQEE